MSGKTQKRIYMQDAVFCSKSEKGDWYLAHTTLDPECKKFGGMRYIAQIDGFPNAKIRTGEEEPVGKPPKQKIRYFLHKDKLALRLLSDYGFEVVTEDSPFLPKKLVLDSSTEAEAQNSDDEEPPSRVPQPEKKRKREESSSERMESEVIASLKRIETALLAMATNFNHMSGSIQQISNACAGATESPDRSPTTNTGSDVVS